MRCDLGDDSGGTVTEPDGGVALIPVLASRTRRPECVEVALPKKLRVTHVQVLFPSAGAQAPDSAADTTLHRRTEQSGSPGNGGQEEPAGEKSPEEEQLRRCHFFYDFLPIFHLFSCIIYLVYICYFSPS